MSTDRSGLVSGCRGLAHDLSLLEAYSLHTVHRFLFANQLLLTLTCLLPFQSVRSPDMQCIDSDMQ